MYCSLAGYQSTRHTIISSHGHVVTQSTHHRSTHHRRIFFHTVISSHGQVVTRSSCHKQALYKAMGRGPNYSGHVDIKGYYQRAKFGCLRLLRGDSREGVNVFL